MTHTHTHSLSLSLTSCIKLLYEIWGNLPSYIDDVVSSVPPLAETYLLSRLLDELVMLLRLNGRHIQYQLSGVQFLAAVG